jgi:hypothetical protein
MNAREYVGGMPVAFLDSPGLWKIEGNKAVAQNNDKVWNLAKQVAGDGRYYKQLQLPEGRSSWADIRPGDVVDISPLTSDVWNYKNAADVWKIQTVLANNQERFKLGRVRPTGKYDKETRQAVCQFQAALMSMGYDLPVFKNDGYWGRETHEAFARAERDGKVNWRYAHVKVGLFMTISAQAPSFAEKRLGGESGGVSFGGRLIGVDDLSGTLSSTPATFMTERKSGQGFSVGVDAIVAIVYGARGTVNISTKGFDWGISVGPVKSKYVTKAKRLKSLLQIVEKVGTIKGHADKIMAAYKAAAELGGDGIWKGDKGFIAIPTWGLSIGAHAGNTKTSILSSEE